VSSDAKSSSNYKDVVILINYNSTSIWPAKSYDARSRTVVSKFK